MPGGKTNGGEAPNGHDEGRDFNPAEWRAYLSEKRTEKEYLAAIEELRQGFQGIIERVDLKDPAKINEAGEAINDLITSIIAVSNESILEEIPEEATDEIGVHMLAAHSALNEARSAHVVGQISAAQVHMGDALLSLSHAGNKLLDEIKKARTTFPDVGEPQ